MNYHLRVHCFQCMNQTGDKETRNVHVELSSARDVISKVAAKEQIHDKIQVHGILKRIVHVHDELTLNHR